MPRLRLLIVCPDSFPESQLSAIARGEEPSLDVVELATLAEADMLTFDSLRPGAGTKAESACPYRSRVVAGPSVLPAGDGKVRRSKSLYVTLAREAVRRAPEYDAVLLTGEDVGIPYAWFARGRDGIPPAVLIAHYLNPAKKWMPLRYLGLAKAFAKVITYSPAQHLFVTERLGLRPERVELIPFHADDRFYAPDERVRRESELVVSVGFERRDYHTLFRALEGTGARLEMAAGSPWSRFGRRLPTIPDYAHNAYRSRAELRDLYRRAAAVVVPLVETDFQAGISVATEAMSCGAPVILSRTRGLQHLITERVEGVLVTPGDAAALRSSIALLRENLRLGGSLGRAGRAKVEDMMTTGHFIARLEAICRAAVRREPAAQFYLIPSLVSPATGGF